LAETLEAISDCAIERFEKRTRVHGVRILGRDRQAGQPLPPAVRRHQFRLWRYWHDRHSGRPCDTPENAVVPRYSPRPAAGATSGGGGTAAFSLWNRAGSRGGGGWKFFGGKTLHTPPMCAVAGVVFFNNE